MTGVVAEKVVVGTNETFNGNTPSLSVTEPSEASPSVVDRDLLDPCLPEKPKLSDTTISITTSGANSDTDADPTSSAPGISKDTPRLKSARRNEASRQLAKEIRVQFDNQNNIKYPERSTGSKPAEIGRSGHERNNNINPPRVNNYKRAANAGEPERRQSSGTMDSLLDSAVNWLAKFSLGTKDTSASPRGSGAKDGLKTAEELEMRNYVEFHCWQGEAVRPVNSPVTAYKQTADEYRLVSPDYNKTRMVLKLYYTFMSLHYEEIHDCPEDLIHPFCDCFCHDRAGERSNCLCDQDLEYNEIVSIHRRKVDPLYPVENKQQDDEAYIEMVFKEEPRSFVLRCETSSKLRDEVLKRAKASRNRFKINPPGVYGNY
ncbi:hypothetical protein SARC_08450 [Sphaeroforma arctica JP610]|uniref:Uncharacterized protein n=1 Tax=Sphaeroforma arctica JP610 TaxID=667725 RepID=A0A0L0FQS5_9EUKA|nr:hypothetical protein SARC_08450 [Sphaeroforma arctica JP610]KNC79142.1 hypothetical protein SARC_08450 [Sphaeroforma arctica JP610]|eukprot:XP_014153044.1 hypothetical protein SARC_08450 [Sphaeroforma arctica JP610]